MNTWLIVGLIAGAAIVLAIVIIVVIMTKKTKGTPAEVTLDDRELISENERAMEAILVLCEGNEALTEEIKKVREQVKYLTPVNDPKVIDFDKKIKNQIQDLRIALNKDGSEDNVKAVNALTQLRLLISDRKAKV